MLVSAPQHPTRRASSADFRRGHDQRRLAGEIGRGEFRRVVARRGRQRHAEAENGAAAGLAVHHDAAVHALDDALGDGQPQASTGELAGGGSVGLLEIAEHARLILRP